MTSVDIKISELEREISRLIDSKVPYQKDYALLISQEERICQVIELFDELTDENDLLNASIRHMVELHADNVSFPGMDKYTDFSLLNGTVNQLIEYFDSYTHDLKKVCKEIDEKKEEIGHKVDSIESQLSSLRNRISGLRSMAVYQSNSGLH